MNEMISFVSWYFAGVMWYFIGLAVLGVFFYKTENSVTLLEFVGILVASVLGPITIFLPIFYLLDTHGHKLLFRWRH